MEHRTYRTEGQKELWYDYYTPEECARLFWPVACRIFDQGQDGVDLASIKHPLFNDTGWPLVMLIGDVSHYPLTEDERRKDDGTVEELSEIFDRDELAPLWEILKEDGGEEVILCSADNYSKTPSDAPEAAVFPPQREFVWEPSNELDCILILPHYLFDRTARWGFIGMAEEKGILGGEPEFMARYIEKAGGIADLQRRFNNCVMSRYAERPYDLSCWRYVYKMVGWPFPFDDVDYPKEKKDGFWHKLSDYLK